MGVRQCRIDLTLNPGLAAKQIGNSSPQRMIKVTDGSAFLLLSLWSATLKCVTLRCSPLYPPPEKACITVKCIEKPLVVRIHALLFAHGDEVFPPLTLTLQILSLLSSFEAKKSQMSQHTQTETPPQLMLYSSK